MSLLSHHLNQLVSIPSHSGDILAKQYVVEYCSKHFSKYNLFREIHSSSGLPALYASSLGKKHTKVMLACHLDVVPAKDYEMNENNGRFVGRGVFDMKFAAACYLHLIDQLHGELQDYDFSIMLTSDEEIGGENGSAFLLEHGYSADVCILPDGGDNWQLEEACNSVWIIKISASGESAHGSRPWEGNNAIVSLIECIGTISALFTNKKLENTLTISQINGGCALNQVPDNAWATLDMRFTDEDSYTKMRVQIETIIMRAGLELESVAHVGATKLNKGNALVKNFVDLAKSSAPVEFGFSHSLGSSDAHYFESRGIPTILMRPRGGGAHSDHEWIEKEDLDLYYELIKQYILQNAKVS